LGFTEGEIRNSDLRLLGQPALASGPARLLLILDQPSGRLRTWTAAEVDLARLAVDADGAIKVTALGAALFLNPGHDMLPCCNLHTLLDYIRASFPFAFHTSNLAKMHNLRHTDKATWAG